MAKVLVLDVHEDEFRLTECMELDDFYRELGDGVTVFDIARRKVGEKYYDIFVDDEGLLKDSPVVSAVDGEGQPMLVGNLIFASHDNQGNTTSLSDDDVIEIMEHAVKVFTRLRPEGYAAIKCEY